MSNIGEKEKKIKKVIKNEKKKKKFKVPHVYVILFMIMVVAAIATYLVPAGQFSRITLDTGREVIDPSSFEYIENNPASIFDIFKAIPMGMNRAVDVIFMVVLTLAGMEIINKTGVIQIAISHLIKKLKGKETATLVIVSLIFTGVGAFVGWAEGILMFVPIGVSLAVAMGYDALVGFMMVTATAGMGFAVGVTNIYTVGVAQGILGLPLFSGMSFRMAMLAVLTTVTIWYILRYAKKVKNNPESSLMKGTDLNIEEIDIDKVEDFTLRLKLVLLTLFAGFFFAVYGCLQWGWFMREIAATFTLAGIVGGLIAGRELDQIALDYAEGAKKIIGAGITIGLARAILVIMENGQIIDTLILYLSNAVQVLPTSLSAVGMYIVQVVINFFIPSGSGQAVVTVPILGPLSEIVGSTQQVAVIAYQLGDGFTNRIFPTSAALMAGLAFAGGIPYEKYFKLMLPLMALWIIIGGIFVAIADAITLGPF